MIKNIFCVGFSYHQFLLKSELFSYKLLKKSKRRLKFDSAKLDLQISFFFSRKFLIKKSIKAKQKRKGEDFFTLTGGKQYIIDKIFPNYLHKKIRL